MISGFFFFFLGTGVFEKKINSIWLGVDFEDERKARVFGLCVVFSMWVCFWAFRGGEKQLKSYVAGVDERCL